MCHVCFHPVASTQSRTLLFFHLLHKDSHIALLLYHSGGRGVSGGGAALQVGHRGVQAAAGGGAKLPAHVTWLMITLHLRAFAFVYVNVDYVSS